MLSHTLLLPAAITVMVFLIFSMTLRKNKKAGEKKRLAALYLAAPFVFFYFALIFIDRRMYPDFLVPVAGGISIVLFILFRKKIFIFKNRCVECGKSVGPYRAIYLDNPRCADCEDPAAEAAEQNDTPRLKIQPVKTIKARIIPSDVNAIDWDNWREDEKAVLCFIRRKDEVLLIHKKTGLGAGKINAPGGRINKNESPEDAAVREVKEEVLLDVNEPRYAGELYFQFTNGYKLHCTVFTADKFSGSEKETEEADPFWCKTDAIPFEKMWADDIHWIPLMLEGKKFAGYYIFKDDVMLSYRLER